MSELKFSEPNDLLEIKELANVDDFLEEMKSVGEIDEITGNYGEDVYRLCNNAVAWMLMRLHGSLYFFNLEIARGTFQGKDHTWIVIGDYYVDPTLAQFIQDAPRIAFICNEDADGYYIDERVDPYEFAKQVKEGVC